MLYNTDCRRALEDIEPGTMDLIFTDPPYVKDQWEEAYTTLGELGAKLLKPSGYLITYCGHYYLPGVHDILRAAGLIYYWQVAQLNHGAKSLMHHRNILCGYKPILIYQNPPLNPENRIFMDVIRGTQSKRYHAWEQSIKEALELLSQFPGKTILEPFAGSGTTLLAAKCLGLDWTGYEINPDTYQIALQRLEQVPLDLDYYSKEVTA
jgi:site-specific DNA-methyltransferase (adenine-specific)